MDYCSLYFAGFSQTRSWATATLCPDHCYFRPQQVIFKSRLSTEMETAACLWMGVAYKRYLNRFKKVVQRFILQASLQPGLKCFHLETKNYFQRQQNVLPKCINDLWTLSCLLKGALSLFSLDAEQLQDLCPLMTQKGERKGGHRFLKSYFCVGYYVLLF